MRLEVSEKLTSFNAELTSVNRACYLDGALVPQKPSQSPEPKACAGNDGTTIVVSIHLSPHFAMQT